MERSKKRIQLWKKALIHFSLCFVMGFFTGFAPASTAYIFSTSSSNAAGDHLVSSFRRQDAGSLLKAQSFENSDESGVVNRSLMAELPLPTSSPATPTVASDFPSSTIEGGRERGELLDEEDAQVEVGSMTSTPRKLLIVITTTRSSDRFQGPFLRRLAHTLRLVPPPLLWIVVQAHAESSTTAEMLRSTGVMHRHLNFKENITDAGAEANHQRNVALSHIEYHRLSGIVHFAGVSNFYDLRFFDEIRQIEVFGAWQVAMVSTNWKKVVLDGPICQSSKIVGWFSGELGNGTANARNLMNNAGTNMKPSKINVSGFAFNSSILWDPERWGRSTSLPDTSQDSIKFVQEVVFEDETKLKGIPADCSRIMLWHLYIPGVISLPLHQRHYQGQDQR